MFVSSANPAPHAPGVQNKDVIQPARPAFFTLPVNLSPEEIREMVREVLG